MNIMTKRGQLDNIITYQHICDTNTDMPNIPSDQITLGSVCIVLQGESGGLQVYIANSQKQWQSITTGISGGSSGEGSLQLYICDINEYSQQTGTPTISTPNSSTIYLVPTNNENDLYSEWIYVNNSWERFGSTAINLNNYALLSDVPSNISELTNDVGYLTQQDISTKADKTNTVLNTTLSRGRKAKTTIGEGSLAFGDGVTASGYLSHAEGIGTTASTNYSHAEGQNTLANGIASHAEGTNTVTSSAFSHAEGESSQALGICTHAEGGSTIAAGGYAHSEGISTRASGTYSHSEGNNTIASGNAQHVQGKYNIEDLNNKYADIVGIGTYDNARANGYTLDWSGNGWYAGKVTVENTTPTENGDLTSKAYVDAAIDNIELASSEDAEAWASGTRSGNVVPDTDPTYHNNAKYYAEQAFSATPEGYETLVEEVNNLVDDTGELKNSMTNYNVTNYALANGDFATKTNNGVTFTWNNKHTVCTLNGTPTGYAVDRYLYNNSSIMGLEPGKTYLFNVIPSNTATGIDLYFYINGTLGTSIEITVPTYVTIPSNATGILSRVMAHSEAGAMTNATVRVEILNAPPVKDMLYVRSAVPYVSNNTLTLGNIRENGWYVIDGSWNATDGPAALDGVGRVLTVECYSPNTMAQNMIKQTIEGVLAPNNRKVFKRLRAGGSWTSWVDMTPFTRATIIPTGDSTDRTIEITAALTRDGVCILAPGEYYVTNIEMPAGTAIKGSGIGVTKLIMISGESGPCVKMGTRCSVSDISLYGQESSGYMTQGDRHGIGWVGTYESESSPGEYPLQGQIENLYIEGFTGGGLYCYKTSMHSESGIQATNITIYKCWCGVYNPLISEYCQFTNIRVNSCLYGAYVSGGNNVFTNCSFTSCVCGLFMYDDGDTATNNSHGSFVGCCFNHSNNNTGIGISISGMDNGEVFVGCQIFYGRINIKWSKGIRFVGCNFGRGTGITVQNSSAVGFDACQFRSASDSPLTQSDATGLRFSGCMNYDGTEFNPLS